MPNSTRIFGSLEIVGLSSRDFDIAWRFSPLPTKWESWEEGKSYHSIVGLGDATSAVLVRWKWMVVLYVSRTLIASTSFFSLFTLPNAFRKRESCTEGVHLSMIALILLICLIQPFIADDSLGCISWFCGLSKLRLCSFWTTLSSNESWWSTSWYTAGVWSRAFLNSQSLDKPREMMSINEAIAETALIAANASVISTRVSARRSEATTNIGYDPKVSFNGEMLTVCFESDLAYLATVQIWRNSSWRLGVRTATAVASPRSAGEKAEIKTLRVNPMENFAWAVGWYRQSTWKKKN